MLSDQFLRDLGVRVAPPPPLNEATYAFEERAAIFEFDGGLARADAERLAKAETFAERVASSARAGDEALWLTAARHPAVRRMLEVFGGEIVAVRRDGEPE